MPQVDREAVRLLVVSPAGRVLLLRLVPSFREPFWVTPGGGIDDGESMEEAARRELREEVGRDDLGIGPFLWTRDVEFTWESWHVRQREHTFLVQADTEFDSVVTHADIEPIAGSRWFDAGELRELSEIVYPEDLAVRLERLLGEGVVAAQEWGPVATGRSGSEDQSDHEPS
jgi:8-oxo-dGTP pyrophosphatase MutT (NUDIX family)